MPLEPDAHSTLLAALADEARAHRLAPKLLVGPRLGVGRELLRALALAGVDWVGFEPTTPQTLAHRLIATDLAVAGIRRADQFDELAFADQAMDAVFARPEALPLAVLADGAGFRDAVRGTLEALRLEGVGAATLRRAPLAEPVKRSVLAAILDAYEALLAEHAMVDAAGLLRRALGAMEAGEAALPAGRILLLPGLDRRGLTGRFVDRLIERGAAVLPMDPVQGREPPVGRLWPGAGGQAPPDGPAVGPSPTAPADPSAAPAARHVAHPVLDLFAAASPADELREVLRRVLALGLRWDEVEIVATDADLYGSTLDGLARALSIPVTYAAGLPVARTRPGRALAGYLRWMQEDFRADLLRAMLEAGDLEPPEPHRHVSAVAVAARLRRLRIGWGRDRYAEALTAALARLADPPAPRGDDDADHEERLARHERERAEVAALNALVRPILDAAPPVPALGRADGLPVSPADIARGMLALLDRVPAGAATDASARDRLRARLERAAATLTRATSFGAALAVLRTRLIVRVAGPGEDGSAPWGAAGGHLHVADLEHGGLTGRRCTFVVGLDAHRFPGAGLQDPVLSDDDRRRLGAAAGRPPMATSAERLNERRFLLDALVARLRGRVTLSFSAWNAAEARKVAPAAAVLDAFRRKTGDPAAGYEKLHETLGEPASAVPRAHAALEPAAAAAPLDPDDVWLAALSAPGGALRAGVEVVLAAHPALRRGLQARDARRRAEATPHHGRIRPRPDLLDPRRSPGIVVSASRLETLGACPLKYLHRHVLRVRPPDDPRFEPDAWLDPLERGSLLHRVFEYALQDARRRGVPPAADAFATLTLDTLRREAAAARRHTPPPSEAVYGRELRDLEDDVVAFIRMAREDGDAWLDLELHFGPGGEHPPVELPLPGGAAIRVQGRIDRVDALADGRLRVLDYKTGTPRRYGREPFAGGRRLQHVLYARAAEALLQADVAAFEYVFPTRKGQNRVARYPRHALQPGPSIIDRLLDLLAAGHLLPTEQPDDCRFCDYAHVCRVDVDAYGKTASPLAEWAREHLPVLDEYAPLREVRAHE